MYYSNDVVAMVVDRPVAHQHVDVVWHLGINRLECPFVAHERQSKNWRDHGTVELNPVNYNGGVVDEMHVSRKNPVLNESAPIGSETPSRGFQV